MLFVYIYKCSNLFSKSQDNLFSKSQGYCSNSWIEDTKSSLFINNTTYNEKGSG